MGADIQSSFVRVLQSPRNLTEKTTNNVSFSSPLLNFAVGEVFC